MLYCCRLDILILTTKLIWQYKNKQIKKSNFNYKKMRPCRSMSILKIVFRLVALQQTRHSSKRKFVSRHVSRYIQCILIFIPQMHTSNTSLWTSKDLHTQDCKWIQQTQASKRLKITQGCLWTQQTHASWVILTLFIEFRSHFSFLL